MIKSTLALLLILVYVKRMAVEGAPIFEFVKKGFSVIQHRLFKTKSASASQTNYDQLDSSSYSQRQSSFSDAGRGSFTGDTSDSDDDGDDRSFVDSDVAGDERRVAKTRELLERNPDKVSDAAEIFEELRKKINSPNRQDKLEARKELKELRYKLRGQDPAPTINFNGRDKRVWIDVKGSQERRKNEAEAEDMWQKLLKLLKKGWNLLFGWLYRFDMGDKPKENKKTEPTDKKTNPPKEVDKHKLEDPKSAAKGTGANQNRRNSLSNNPANSAEKSKIESQQDVPPKKESQKDGEEHSSAAMKNEEITSSSVEPNDKPKPKDEGNPAVTATQNGEGANQPTPADLEKEKLEREYLASIKNKNPDATAPQQQRELVDIFDNDSLGTGKGRQLNPNLSSTNAEGKTHSSPRPVANQVPQP